MPSIINLNVSSLNISKKTDYESGLKHQTQLHVVHKKSTLNIKTYRWKEWRKMYHVNTKQKKDGLAILTADRKF